MPRTPLFITNHMVDTYENTFRLVERFLLRGKRKREKEKEKKKKVKKKKKKGRKKKKENKAVQPDICCVVIIRKRNRQTLISKNFRGG